MVEDDAETSTIIVIQESAKESWVVNTIFLVLATLMLVACLFLGADLMGFGATLGWIIIYLMTIQARQNSYTLDGAKTKIDLLLKAREDGKLDAR